MALRAVASGNRWQIRTASNCSGSAAFSSASFSVSSATTSWPAVSRIRLRKRESSGSVLRDRIFIASFRVGFELLPALLVNGQPSSPRPKRWPSSPCKLAQRHSCQINPALSIALDERQLVDLHLAGIGILLPALSRNLDHFGDLVRGVRLDDGQVRHVRPRLLEVKHATIHTITQFAHAISTMGHADENRGRHWKETLHVAHGDFKRNSRMTNIFQQFDGLLLGAAQWTRRQDRQVSVSVRMRGVQFAAQLFYKYPYRAANVGNPGIQERSHEAYIIAATGQQRRHQSRTHPQTLPRKFPGLHALRNDVERELRASYAASSIVQKQCNPEDLQWKDDCCREELRKGG